MRILRVYVYICIFILWLHNISTVTKVLWTRERKNERTIGEHPNDRITEIGQNTEKSPGDLRRTAVTQSPVENSQMSKIVIIIIIINNNNNEKHERGLITAIRNDTSDTMDNRMTITRKQK